MFKTIQIQQLKQSVVTECKFTEMKFNWELVFLRLHRDYSFTCKVRD